MIYTFILLLIPSIMVYAGCTNDHNGRSQKETILNQKSDPGYTDSDSSQVKKVPDMPVLIKKTAPVYPEEARKKGIQGDVHVQILVGIDGQVKEASIFKNESNSKDLEKAALDAIYKWKFEPGKLDGKPVEVHVIIPIKFKLSDEKKD